MLCRVCLTSFLLIALAAPVTAQRPDSLTGELRQTFREVRGVLELPDGRVLVLDSHERLVYVADFRTGETTLVGSQGTGEGQYLRPSRLLALKADTTLIWDEVAGRIHVLDWVGGRPGIRRSIPTHLFGPEHRFTAVASDDRSRLYSEVPIGEGRLLLRWSPGELRVDTILHMRLREVQGLFPARDRWVVSPNGVLAYVHVSPYRVDLRVPGAPVVVGRPIAFDPKLDTPAFRSAWSNALREPKISWSRKTGEEPQFMESYDSPVDYTGPWPLVTPAFVALRPHIQFASDGSLLIERVSVPALPTEYDVISDRAELKDRFELAPGTNIVATGRDVVYVTVRTSESRFRRFTLQRFTVRPAR
jgi:hypothetical protein